MKFSFGPWRTKPKKEPYQARMEGQELDGELEPGSPTWIFMHNWASKKLVNDRELNDAPHLDERKTAKIRGRIEVYKEMLGLPDEK